MVFTEPWIVPSDTATWPEAACTLSISPAIWLVAWAACAARFLTSCATTANPRPDSPALAAAAVGLAMGTGTDVAMESAGITLLGGDLMGIVRARTLSQATMRNIRQNLALSFVYNLAGVPLAAGVLYPFFGLLLSPVVAAAAMALSSVSVIGNALRLRALKL